MKGFTTDTAEDNRYSGEKIGLMTAQELKYQRSISDYYIKVLAGVFVTEKIAYQLVVGGTAETREVEKLTQIGRWVFRSQSEGIPQSRIYRYIGWQQAFVRIYR